MTGPGIRPGFVMSFLDALSILRTRPSTRCEVDQPVLVSGDKWQTGHLPLIVPPVRETGTGTGRFVAVVTALVVGLSVLLAAPTAQAEDGTAARTTARWSGAIDTSSRAAVNNAYWTRYAQYYNTSTGWVGNLLGCLLGWTSSSSHTATRSAINYVRSLNGLAPVGFDSTMNRRAQATALMMAANKTLSHYPTSGWRCYSSVGDSTAAKSNLALAYPKIGSGQLVDLYMDDRGSSNTAVGHRRWILNPFTTYMGNGSTSTSNALTVVGPTRSTRPNPRWTSWPSSGYFPSKMEPAGRWSVSSGFRNANFSAATVRVFRNGVRVPVKRYYPKQGHAMPTMVFQLPPATSRVGTWRIVVKNVKRSGYSPMSYTYRSRIFTPTR